MWKGIGPSSLKVNLPAKRTDVVYSVQGNRFLKLIGTAARACVASASLMKIEMEIGDVAILQKTSGSPKFTVPIPVKCAVQRGKRRILGLKAAALYVAMVRLRVKKMVIIPVAVMVITPLPL